MLKIIVSVLPVWRRWPLTSSDMARFCGFGISSRVTSHGPSGPNVSAHLPFIHWPPRSAWKWRSEMSLQMA